MINICFEPVEKTTTPPKHYTVETLNNYLKNPFKDDKAKAKELEESGEVDDAEDYKAIFEGLELGTEATRSGIIDNAKKSKYIELKKDVKCTEEEINEFCLELPRYKRPRKIIFADVPRNPTGKIEKPKLREMYCGGSLIEAQTCS